MPGPADLPAEVDLSDAERTELIEEFLGSPEAKALPDEPITRSCAVMIVDLFADYDVEQPLRVSPTKVELFVHEWLPDEDLEDEMIEAMPAVFVAWVRWAGARGALPAAALDQLVEQTEECAGHLAEAYDEADVSETYLADVESEDPDEVTAILERRIFAVPETSAQIGEELYPELDPTNSDDLGLILKGEHPDWHHLLDDPSFDGEVDGVNPRLHLAIHEVIANQLWHNDPPEVWPAAQRLLRGGADRHEVLHELMRLVSDHLYAGLNSGQPADVATYRKALDQLGRSRVRKLR
jgi:hypothetical protein